MSTLSNYHSSQSPTNLTLEAVLDHFNAADIPAKLHGYVLHESVKPENVRLGQYLPITKGNKNYYLYVDNNYEMDLVSDKFVRKVTKSKHILTRSTHIDFLLASNSRYREWQPALIIPRYIPFCRSSLSPFAGSVTRQVLKGLRCLHKNEITYRGIKRENIAWKWNKKHTRPHIYLTKFRKASSVLKNAARIGRKYDVCKRDVYHAGVLMLELLLDRDLPHLYKQDYVRMREREEYYREIDCPVTCDLLEQLLVQWRDRITADKALKHKYFR